MYEYEPLSTFDSSTLVETYLGIQIWEEKNIYFADVRSRKTQRYEELQNHNIDILKDEIDSILAFNYHDELINICANFGINPNVIHNDNEMYEQIIMKIEKKIIDAVKETLS